MAAKIRLKRVGRRGQPSYRVVVLDGKKPRDAKVVADLGHYDPKTNPPTFEVDGDGALKWLLDGAKPTRAARNILAKAGVMTAWDAAKRGETVEIEAKELKPTTKPKKAKAAPADEAPAETEAETTEAPPADEEPAAEAEPEAAPAEAITEAPEADEPVDEATDDAEETAEEAKDEDKA